MCVPQTVSPLLRRISWIFLKWIKIKKKNVLFNVKNTVLMMLNFLNAPTLNVKNKKCAWSVAEKPLYCTLCRQSTKCNQSRSSQSSQAFRADLGRYPDISTPIQRCSTSDWIVFGPCSSNECCSFVLWSCADPGWENGKVAFCCCEERWMIGAV